MTSIRFQAELKRADDLRPDVEEELRKTRGVLRVGVSLCPGTDALAFQVYVAPGGWFDWLALLKKLPRTIQGFPVDVQRIQRFVPHCGSGAIRPLTGGIAVAKDPSGAPGSFGTLGCFVTLSGGKQALLTNEHVLRSSLLLSTPNTVYQPMFDICMGFTCNEVGNSIREYGQHGNHAFNGTTYFVDCAVAEVVNTGFRNALRKIENSTDGETSVPLDPGVVGQVMRNSDGLVTKILDGSGQQVDTTKILGSAAPQVGSLVWKVGATTGLTVGKIISITRHAQVSRFGQDYDCDNQIEVQPIAGYRDGSTELFSDRGDSGSVYLDLENRVVGLHHAGLGGNSLGSNIDAVKHRLENAVVMDDDGSATHATAAESTILAQQLWAEVPPSIETLRGAGEEFRARLSATERGRRLVALTMTHRAELSRLVNARKNVTVVWHRHHGPAFVASLARCLTTPGSTVPLELGGVKRRDLLFAMTDVLEERGSPSLRDAIRELRPWLIDELSEARDPAEFVERFRRAA